MHLNKQKQCLTQQQISILHYKILLLRATEVSTQTGLTAIHTHIYTHTHCCQNLQYQSLTVAFQTGPNNIFRLYHHASFHLNANAERFFTALLMVHNIGQVTKKVLIPNLPGRC